MDDTNTNVNDDIIGDGMPGMVGKLCSPEQAHDTRSSNPGDECHSKAMAVRLAL